MAFIGMRHVVAAKITAETEGSAITYGASGSGMVIGKAIQGNVSWDRNDNPLYADDAIAEDDSGVIGGSLELGVDDLSADAREYVLGLVQQTGTGNTNKYDLTDAPAPYLGVGYVRVRKKNGTLSYQGVWYHKIQFSEGSEDAQTKGESIEWGTPTLTGKIFGVHTDSTGKAYFRVEAWFNSLSDAVSWLDGLANISTSGTTSG